MTEKERQEVNKVLEKLKAEIQYEADNNADVNSMRAYYHCLQIIDKYTHNETKAK